ncbi:MAG: FtsH protease activity modulator HflK [Rhodospirillales bacterium]|nr:FtsH protease activity modulator HflK [Rhodospirillales bacterium]
MPWKSQGGGGSGGGGPWGGGGGGGGPWGGGGPGGPRPPDFEDFIRKGQDRFRRLLPGGLGTGMGLVLLFAGIMILWLASGLYRVQPGQQGVELLFGQWSNSESLSQPGLHWFAPYPIGSVETPQVEQVRQIDIGFRRRGGGTGSAASKSDVSEESLMLTGDQNIIDIDFTVQWRIGNAGEYLFNIRDPEDTVKLAAESAMREVIGRTDIERALSTEKEILASKTRETLQQMLDEYQSGIVITGINLQDVQPPAQVADSFEDVQRARQDRETKINQANAYSNRIIPEARGEATKMIQGAEAYRERLIKEAEGEAQRFLQVYESYKQNPDVTRRRMYLETVQKVLQDTDKVIMDSGSTGVVPYLPLDQLRRGGTDGAGASAGTQQ